MDRQKLRAARLERHWTLAQAAEQVEVDVNTLSRWERGKTRPHGYNVVRLCEVYEKTPTELGLESKQEMADAVEQLMILSSSLSSLHESTPDSAAGQRKQAKVPDEISMLAPSPSSASILSIEPALLPEPPTRRSWKRWRGFLLIVLLVFLVINGGIWYALAHSLANGSGQRQSLSSSVGQVTPTMAAQRTVVSTPTGKIPASPGSPPAQNTPVSSRGTPPVLPRTPTGVPQQTPTSTPSPEPDCLHGSASHLTFSSLLGLGNTSPITVALTNCGGAAEDWSASVATSGGGDWLSVNPAVGTITANGSENVQILAAGSGLQIGTYQGSVTFHKGAAQWAITVTFTIVQV